MEFNSLFLALTVAASGLIITACGSDSDSTPINSSTNNTEKSLSYSDFIVESDGSGDKETVFRSDVMISPSSVRTTYSTVVDNGFTPREDKTTYFILADNFSFQSQQYIDNYKLDPDLGGLVTDLNEDSINISYRADNGTTLDFTDAISQIDISNQPLAYNYNNENGVYVDFGSDSYNPDYIFGGDINLLSFPEGSQCLIFEDTSGDYPYYVFELETIDWQTGDIVSNTVEGYTSLEALLSDRNYNSSNTGVDQIENVGINNQIRAVRLTDESLGYESAYVEYNGAIYQAYYEEGYDYSEDTDPNLDIVYCDGFNDTAADFLEAQYKNYIK